MASRTWKRQRPQKGPPQKDQHRRHLDFSPARLILDSDLQTVLSEDSMLVVICYDGNRKPIHPAMLLASPQAFDVFSLLCKRIQTPFRPQILPLVPLQAFEPPSALHRHIQPFPV